MEESEANSIVTSEGDDNGLQEYPIQATLEETNKLNQQKIEITEKVKERTFDRDRISDVLKSLNYHEAGVKDLVAQTRKKLDILEVRVDKLQFTNNAYQHKPIIHGACFSKQEIDNHVNLEYWIQKLHYRMLHGTGSLAKEKHLLREIKLASKLDVPDETSLSIQQLISYPQSWWWDHSFQYYQGNEKKVKDRLREIKEFEWKRDGTIANATVNGKIWNSLGPKKALEEQIKDLRIKMDESRKKHLEIRAKITRVKKELKDTDREIFWLRKQYADIECKKIELLAQTERGRLTTTTTTCVFVH